MCSHRTASSIRELLSYAIRIRCKQRSDRVGFEPTTSMPAAPRDALCWTARAYSGLRRIISPLSNGNAPVRGYRSVILITAVIDVIRSGSAVPMGFVGRIHAAMILFRRERPNPPTLRRTVMRVGCCDTNVLIPAALEERR